MHGSRSALAAAMFCAVVFLRPPALRADEPKEVPKEVRALEGTYSGAWTLYGIDDKGAVVKKARWTSTTRTGFAEVKDGRAFVPMVSAITFDGAKEPGPKIEGKEGYHLTKDGALGDYFIETAGRVHRVTRLGDNVWTYTKDATEEELTETGFPKGATGQHVVVKIVTRAADAETHLVTRLTTVNWKDKESKEHWLQFVSLQGFHRRQP